MSAWPYPIKAVIFDCDGTILDTTSIYFNANATVAGHPIPPDLKKQCNGRGEQEVSQFVVNYFKLPMTPQEFLNKRNVILEDTLQNCTVIPHVDKLIKKLKSMGLKLAVATSANRKFHDIKTLNHQQIFSLFDYDVCGNEVTEAKPSPEVFQVAASKLGEFKPENILVFEDAIAGIKAANNAKMPVVVYHGKDDDFIQSIEESGARPTITIDNYDNFDYSLFKWN